MKLDEACCEDVLTHKHKGLRTEVSIVFRMEGCIVHTGFCMMGASGLLHLVFCVRKVQVRAVGSVTLDHFFLIQMKIKGLVAKYLQRSK